MEAENQSWSGVVVTSPTTDPDNSNYSIDGKLIRLWISNIVGIPMFIIGMSGNILTLIVLLSSRSFRSTSFGMLLILLSVSDIGVLSTGLLRQCIRGLTWDHGAIRNVCQWCCKVHVYLTYVFIELSSWTLSLVTLERALAVTCPLKTAYLCTKRRMFGAWITILVLVISFNTVIIEKVGVASDPTEESDVDTTTLSPASTEFLTMKETVKVPNANNAYCRIVPPNDFFMTSVMPGIFGLVGYMIPGVAILIMNIILLRRLRAGDEERRSAHTGWSDCADGRLNSETRMLVGISVLFILTNLPLAVHYVYYHYWTGDDHLKAILFIVMLIISYINNAFNFAIYCFRGRKFRAALRDLVSCNWNRNGRDGWAEGRGRATTSNCEWTEFTALS